MRTRIVHVCYVYLMALLLLRTTNGRRTNVVQIGSRADDLTDRDRDVPPGCDLNT